jgi:Zn-dependent protease/predicted transcriptional regulator
MMGDAPTLFRIWGIPVRVHMSWVVIVGLLTWSLSVGYFPQVLPDLPAAAYWTKGLLAALLLFVSVFLHELSHSVAARRYSIPVSGITLHIFGGVSQLEREPDRPGVEFVVAAVGPLTSFAIAAGLVVAQGLLQPAPGTRAIMTYLALVNTVVGVFNLVPGFPLDGGRLLRSLLWKLKGSLSWATRVATQVGSGFAFVLIGIGLLRALRGEFVGGLWLALIGLFLRQAAQGSYQQLVLRQTLGPLAVRDIMMREVIQVPPDLVVAQVVDEFFWRHRVSTFPLVSGGRVAGILTLDRVKQLPRERWAETPARDVMLPLSDALTTTPASSVWEAFEKLVRNGVGRLAVMDRDRLVGYLSIKDVVHILALRSGSELPDGRATSGASPAE